MSASSTNPGVLITRPRESAGQIATWLKHCGANPVICPTISIEKITPDANVAKALRAQGHIELVIFTSKNAVLCGSEALSELPMHPDCLIAAIGPSTRQALQQYGYSQVVMGDSPHDSEALLASNPLQNVQSKLILIIKGMGGRTYLAEQLKARGGIVYRLDTYQRVLPELEQGILQACGQLHFVMFTSSESAANLLKLLPLEYHNAVFQTIPIVGHPRIAKTVARLGFKKKPIIAADPGDEAMFRAFKNNYAIDGDR